MNDRKNRLAIQVGGGACAVFLLVAAILPAAQPGSRVRHAEMTPEQVQLRAGDELYRALCASCHGLEGKGDGPAMIALAIPATDLTTLALRNGGDFPALRTLNAILGDREIRAHGTREMPIWGDVFRVTTGSPARARHRAYALNEFVRSLQTERDVEARRD